jgi:hypothetical protein
MASRLAFLIVCAVGRTNTRSVSWLTMLEIDILESARLVAIDIQGVLLKQYKLLSKVKAHNNLLIPTRNNAGLILAKLSGRAA